MSTGITITATGLQRASKAIGKLAGDNRRQLLDLLGVEVTDQTVERITVGKASPDGAPWRAWTPSHAKTRRNGQSLLEADGHLRESIQHIVGQDQVQIGSNLDYAAIHQLGGLPGMPAGPAGIPARPYLGVSTADAKSLEEIAADYYEDLLK